MLRSCSIPISLFLFASFAPAVGHDEVAQHSYVGARLPELASLGGTWLNSAGALTLEQLCGGPALIVHTSLSSEVGRATSPHLVEWYREHHAAGLNIVQVFGRDAGQLAGVERHVRDGGLEFPVLHDGENRNHDALELRGLPVAFLLDASGVVVWEGFLVDARFEELATRLEALLPVGSARRAAFLGVNLGAAELGGTRIDSVTPGSAADRLGLRDGDILLAIDGRVTDSVQTLRAALRLHAAGDRVELVWRRADRLLSGSIDLGERSSAGSGPVLRPEKAGHVIEVARVTAGQSVADVGFGSGWLSLALVEAVGANGRVYAAEIDASAVEKLQRQAPPNLAVIHSKRDDACLPEGALDTVILHDVASHVAEAARPDFYASVARSLAPTGRLVVFGPHGKAAGMLEELRLHGFAPEDEEALGKLTPELLDEALAAGIRFQAAGAEDTR